MSAHSSSPRGPLILVVDADRLNRTIAREALESEGFCVAEAGNGGEALGIWSNSPPDLLLVDIDDPKLDGVRLCQTIREKYATPILVMAAGDEGATIREALEAGASDFVSKPVRWTLLGTRARYLLRASCVISEAQRGEVTFAHAQRLAGLGTWGWNPKTKVMTWSDYTYRVLGLDPQLEEPSVQRFWKCVHADDREAAREQIDEAIAGGRRFRGQHRLVHPSGALRHVQLCGEVTRDEDGTEVVTGTIQDVTEQRLGEERLLYLANYDSLTGLANRRLFNERLEADIERARSANSRLAVLYVDLDHFKQINDRHGHAFGDKVLQLVAERLANYVRQTDFVCRFGGYGDDPIVSRLGGDEFTVLLSKIEQELNAEEVAQRILGQNDELLIVDGISIRTAASIGISMYPDHGTCPEALVQRADRAMYAAKEAGRNTFRIYDHSLDADTNRKFEIESRLRHAIERCELRLFYQPKVDAQTRRVTGMEALLRWTDEDLGVVSPAEFIPVSEESGLIVEIGEWALHTACRQNKAWQDAGYAPVRVAVNTSIAQFQRQDLGRLVVDALKESGLDPRYLEIEITESIMLEDAESIARVLRDLRDIGVSVALDDFGTGYSSLGFMARLPLDTLKMDRSFVREMDNDPAAVAIANAVIAMARELGLAVVAEGVDTEEQARVLTEQGCAELQGFLFNGALPPDEFVDLLETVSSD